MPTTPTRFPGHAKRPWLACALPLGLLASAAPAWARPPGTNCPDSPVLVASAEAAGRRDVSPLSVTDLQPAVAYHLDGTSAGSNPDLGTGSVIKSLNLPFNWTLGSGVLTGVVRQRVTNAVGRSSCTQQQWVELSGTSTAQVCAVRLTNLLYPAPLPLYGDTRTDTGGDVPGQRVARSAGPGKQVRFKLNRCLLPGEVSERLLLVSEAPQVARDAYLQLEDAAGNLSPKLRIYNTMVP